MAREWWGKRKHLWSEEYADAIERQLAHCEQNDVRAAYNYAEYLSQRREMMQFWADYLDTLRAQRMPVMDVHANNVAII